MQKIVVLGHIVETVIVITKVNHYRDGQLVNTLKLVTTTTEYLAVCTYVAVLFLETDLKISNRLVVVCFEDIPVLWDRVRRQILESDSTNGVLRCVQKAYKLRLVWGLNRDTVKLIDAYSIRTSRSSVDILTVKITTFAIPRPVRMDFFEVHFSALRLAIICSILQSYAAYWYVVWTHPVGSEKAKSGHTL